MHRHSRHSQHVYANIRDKITTGELSPGEVMSEANLAKEYGLSRTPVGEALRQLANEGLVVQVPRYGTVVRQIPAEELEELFEIREALECLAVAKATERITCEGLDELESLCEAIDAEVRRIEDDGAAALDREGLRRFLAADMAFHMLIIANAGNQRLIQVLEQTRAVSLMFTAQRGAHPVSRVIEANTAHRSILAAMADRDPEQAQLRLVHHIRTSRDESLKAAPSPSAVSLGSINLPMFVRRDLA
ncbi:putative HTH-type transcriptional regulator YdfH [Posidoniimonas polymericola]|uniref:Putative HTH-type transcriptional regulator YdfH n=1 Tax=Posidoniimonas polymericola TaxID=2528002 RepID=A0A5C5ZFN7_9BACT|nr:GntR family transcriptional regulator [Posidoniimonas polymericola]TWT86016.1 putative HTH-type transcriptional regulator YdfH [Posidoniimonas polymericola]